MNCRFCQNPLSHVFIDLFNAPPSNSFLDITQLNEAEIFYPLKVYTCQHCYLVQLDEFKKSDAIFDDQYVYFSSYSTTWLQHAALYTEKMVDRFGFDKTSNVVEIASNDGYLLQYFQQRSIPVLGIEPTANTAQVARNKGIDTIVDFFGARLAQRLVAENKQADLLLGNNVLAHVPDIMDFVKGMKILLKQDGVITMEFPHLIQLIENNQFDTIYHEHFSYLSLFAVKQIFASQQLEIFDVEELSTHGGSLRIYAKHMGNTTHYISPNVQQLLDREIATGINNLAYYSSFTERAMRVKSSLLSFLLEQHKQGKKVAAYGAAAKGNTLLNYCGIKNDLIEFVVDANPYKQNKYLPGSHIPVKNEDYLKAGKPDYVIIFPWNLKEEIMKQLFYIRDWNAKFVIPIPDLHVEK